MMKTADKNNQILMETDQEKRGKMSTRICQGIRGKKTTKKHFWFYLILTQEGLFESNKKIVLLEEILLNLL